MPALHECHPKLKRSVLWCRTCKRVEYGGDFAEYLQTGWPKCCGETMTIDSPKERDEFEREGKQ